MDKLREIIKQRHPEFHFLYDFRDKERCAQEYVATMLNRTQRIFKYEGLPDTIPQRDLELLLQINGYVCIAKHNGDLYAFYGGLGGAPNVYYMPTICTVSNPALKLSKTFKIDIDCVIIRNDTLYHGVMDMYLKYATALAENDISFDVATKNSRMLALITAPDEESRKSANKYLEDICNGDLGAAGSNEFLDGIKAQPLANANTRSLTQLIEYQQYLRACWYNDIGLNANYNMKRESLTTTEVQMNFDALLPLIDDMLECRKECLEKVNEMFGTNITVDFTSAWKKIEEASKAEMAVIYREQENKDETIEEAQKEGEGDDADSNESKESD